MQKRSWSLDRIEGRIAARRSRRLLLFFSALLTLACASLTALATPAQLTLQIARVRTDALPDLKIYLTCLSLDGKPIADRTAGDFKLVLDSAEVGSASSLTLFEKSNEPLSVVLLAQTSSVVTDKLLAEVKAGFRRIAQAVAAHPGSHVSVISYAVTSKRLHSGGAADVEGALGRLAVDGEAPESHLLDAMKGAIELLSRQAAGQRKLIIVVSDGIDISRDRRSFVEVGQRAQDAGIVIDVVGHNQFDAAPLQNLQEMTKRAYGTSRIAKTPAEVSSQLGIVADSIEKQYVATFRLNRPSDQEDHVIQVLSPAGNRDVYSNSIVVKLPPAKPSPSAPPRIPPPT